MIKDFCIFILTHGRPNDVITVQTLKKGGYTGPYYLILDNEDKTIDEYRKIYSDEKLLIFDKKCIAQDIDKGDNFNNLRSTTHVRNAIFEAAERLGYIYFMQLDDDYGAFHYRFPEGEKLAFKNITNLNRTFEIFLEFFKNTNVKSIALAQGGDFIGGVGTYNGLTSKIMRKCMNSFICSTKRRFKFISTLNEDVNTYLSLGARGELFITFPQASLVQKQTQSQSSGMTESYLLYGTYIKSFTSVMYAPSSVRVSMMQSTNKRLHHLVNWKTTVPVIIDEIYKK